MQYDNSSTENSGGGSSTTKGYSYDKRIGYTKDMMKGLCDLARRIIISGKDRYTIDFNYFDNNYAAFEQLIRDISKVGTYFPGRFANNDNFELCKIEDSRDLWAYDYDFEGFATKDYDDFVTRLIGLSEEGFVLKHHRLYGGVHFSIFHKKI